MLELSRSPTSPTLLLDIWGRAPSHSPLLNFWLAPGGSRWPPAPILVGPLNWNPHWPLHLLQILNPAGKGGTQSRGHGSPPATPGGASSSVPWIYVCGGPCFRNGLMLPTGSWQGGSSAALSFLLRKPLWPGPSSGPLLPQQDSFPQRNPSSPS